MTEQKKKPGLPCLLTGPEGPIEGFIVRVTSLHVLVNTGSRILRVQGVYQVKFNVPTMAVAIDAEAVVVKTRDEWQSLQNQPSARIHVAELVFKKLNAEEKVGLAYLAGKFAVPV